MSYRVLTGEFHIFYPQNPNNGPEPDGDTIKFKPDVPSLANELESNGSAPSFNSMHMINLRFEGVDALETHFSGAHQDIQYAEAARDFLLHKAGYQVVNFNPNNTKKVSSVTPHPVRGYIYAKGLDPFGRIIAFVFAGDSEATNGSEVFVTPTDIDLSINAQLLRAGLVFPAFYTSLPRDLRMHLAIISREARAANRGLWPKEETDLLLDLVDGEVMKQLVFFPKLFRRLIKYFGEGNIGLAGFDRWIRQDPVNRDDTVLLPDEYEGELSNMHDVYEIRGNKMIIKFDYEDIIIAPDRSIQPISDNTSRATIHNIRIVGAVINPIGDDAGKETVTIMNVSADDINLNGWRLTDNSSPNGGISLDAHGTLRSGAILTITLDRSVALNNTGDEIILVASDGTRRHQVVYRRSDIQAPGWTTIF